MRRGVPKKELVGIKVLPVHGASVGSLLAVLALAFLSLSIGEQSLTNRGGGNSGDQSFCVRFSYLYYNQLFSIVEQSLNNTVDKAFGSLLPLPTKTSLFDWCTLLQKVTQS